MRSLSARDVLEAWDEGRRAAAAERVSPALVRALPEAAPDDLDRLPLGRRDALLLDLHRATFGGALDLHARCPECGSGLELALAVDDLLAGDRPAGSVPVEPAIAAHEVVLGAGESALEVRFRLATSADLRAAARATDAAAARAVLVGRLVKEARRGGETLTPEELAGLLRDGEIAHLAAAMTAADPLAEILLDLTCPDCGESWQALLDVVDCLWRRVEGTARALLTEVHVLARSYGWREADILALGAGRRRAYLEMIAGREARA